MEADSGGVTEAGTTQRDVVREGVVQIGVTFRVSKKWLNKFSAYKKLASITVGYLDTATSNLVTTQMYREKKGAFEGIEEEIELIGFCNCGGCPAKKAVLRARKLVERITACVKRA